VEGGKGGGADWGSGVCSARWRDQQEHPAPNASQAAPLSSPHLQGLASTLAHDWGGSQNHRVCRAHKGAGARQRCYTSLCTDGTSPSSNHASRL